MNGPIKMYRMKPVINHDFAVELPKCMYRMKNIHSQRNIADGTNDHVSSPDKNLEIFDQVKQFLKNCQEIPGMAELEAKQNDILEQLAQLKKQIHSLKCDLNIQNDSTLKQVTASIQCPKPILSSNSLPENIVISGSPVSPPYSLQILQGLLQNQIGLAVTSYLHSSVVSMPEPALRLKDSLGNFKPKPGVPVVNVKLIWKNISSNAEFLLSHTPVTGEVNLLRYLSRLTHSELSYDSDANSVEIDSILDQCYLLVRAKTKTERTSILQILTKSLSKSQWLAGNNRPGIADVATYSAVKQCVSPNELSANLGKWYDRCQTLVSS